MVWKHRNLDGLGVLSQSLKPSVSKYARIAAVLRGEIHTGVYPHGSTLPSEVRIAARFGVARLTARRALETLASENVVVRRPGRGHGTRVSWRGATNPARRSMTDLLAHYETLGEETRVELLSQDIVAAGAQVGAYLCCPDDMSVARFVRRRLISGRPFSLFTTYVPETVGCQFLEDDAPDIPIIELIEARGHRVTHAEQFITACVADETAARFLALAPGDALINVCRVAYTEAEKPIEYISVLYRPTDYNYRISLARANEGAPSYWTARASI